MKDHYTTLGVSRQATKEDIKVAYRKLASLHHPDRGGNTAEFQKIQQAYDVLGDEGRRKEYDNPIQPRIFSRNHHAFHQGMPDIMEQFFHGHRSQIRSVRLQLWITLQDVILGGPRPVSVPTNNGHINVEIMIPKGIEDGDTIRYPQLGGPQSDLVITFRILPHPTWQRQSNNLMGCTKVDIWTLVTGGSVNVDLLDGKCVNLSIPAMTQPEAVLRLRGQGLPGKHDTSPGDALIRIQAVIPTDIDPDVLDLIKQKYQK